MPKRLDTTPKKDRPRKSFPEEQGISRILALSQQAVQKKDEQYQKVLDHEHAKREHFEQIRKERARKKESSRKASHIPSKTSIMSQLLERERERSRERKKKRKALVEEAPHTDKANERPQGRKKAHVSFDSSAATNPVRTSEAPQNSDGKDLRSSMKKPNPASSVLQLKKKRVSFG